MNEQLLSWGWGGFGQLGRNSQSDTNKPSEVPGPWQGQNSEVYPVKMAGGEWHSAVVLNDGSVYTCGYGRHGAIGQGYTDSVLTFTKVKMGSETVVDACCGQTHTFFLTASGKLYACGWSGYGQLGLGTTDYYVKPTLVPIGNADVIKVATRGHLTLFLTSDGKVYRSGFSEALGSRKLSPKLIGTLPFPATECTTFACPAQTVPERGVYGGDLFIVGQNGTVITHSVGGKGKLKPSTFYTELAQQYGGIREACLTYRDAILLLHDRRVVRVQEGSAEVTVLGQGPYEHVSAGNAHVLAVGPEGELWVWGRNDKAQHGLGHHDVVDGWSRVPLKEGMAVRRVHAGPDYNFITATPVCAVHAALSRVCESEDYADVTLVVRAGTGSDTGTMEYSRRIHGAIASATWPSLYSSLRGHSAEDWVDVGGDGTADVDVGRVEEVDDFDHVWSLEVKDMVIDEDTFKLFVGMLYGRYLTALPLNQRDQLRALCAAASITPVEHSDGGMRLVPNPTAMRDHARSLYNTGLGSDVTLVIEDEESGGGGGGRGEPGEKVEILAHRFLLSARSPYFAGMFRAGSRFDEGRRSSVTLPAQYGVTATANVIKFIYGIPLKSMELDPSIAYGMLHTSTYLLVDDLKSDTELRRSIKRGVSPSNVVHLHALAVDQGMDWLERRVVDYLVAHHTKCAADPSYTDLPEAVRSEVDRRVELCAKIDSAIDTKGRRKKGERMSRKGKERDTSDSYDSDVGQPTTTADTDKKKGKGRKGRKKKKGHKGTDKVHLGVGGLDIMGMFKRWGKKKA